MPQNFFEPRTPVKRRQASAFEPRASSPRTGDGQAPEPARPEEPSGPPPSGQPTSGPPPREPSWLRIYWNTLRSFTRRRLGLGPRPPREDDGPRSRRPLLIAVAVTVAVALLAVAVVLTKSGGGSDPSAAPATPTATPADGEPSPQVRNAVAAWVATHVGPGQVVACDAAVCGALAARDFPASSTVWVRDSVQELQSADVAVLTSTLRARLGAAVDEVTAAEPLAAFGAGTQRVTIRAVAHAGRAAYASAATADLADRRFAGTALLKNKRLTLAASARTLLAAGQVDIRLCALLATLSSGHTLTVASFGAPSPGAGAGVPRTAMDLLTVDKAAATGTTGPAGALRALIAAQQAPYRPLSVTVRPAEAPAPAVLTVLFSQPAPVDLVDNPTP